MAKATKPKNKPVSKPKTGSPAPSLPAIPAHRKQEILGLILMVVAFFWAMAVLTYHPADDVLVSKEALGDDLMGNENIAKNALGRLGARLAYWLVPNFFGYFSVGIPLLMMMVGYAMFRHRPIQSLSTPFVSILWGSLLLACVGGWAGLAFTDVNPQDPAPNVLKWSGAIGFGVANWMYGVLGAAGSLILLLLVLGIAVLLLMDRDIQKTLDRTEEFLQNTKENAVLWWADQREKKTLKAEERALQQAEALPKLPKKAPASAPLPASQPTPTAVVPSSGLAAGPAWQIPGAPTPPASKPLVRQIPDEFDLDQDILAYRGQESLAPRQQRAQEQRWQVPPPPITEPSAPQPKPAPPALPTPDPILGTHQQFELPLTIRQTPTPPPVAKPKLPQQVVTRNVFEADYALPPIDLLADSENEARRAAEIELKQVEQLIRSLLERQQIEVTGIEAEHANTYNTYKIGITSSPELYLLKHIEDEVSKSHRHSRITIPLWAHASIAVEVEQRFRTQMEEVYGNLVEAITNANLQISALNQTKIASGTRYDLMPSQEVEARQLFQFSAEVAQIPNTKSLLIPGLGYPTLFFRVPTKMGIDLEDKKQMLIEKLMTYNIQITRIEAIVGPTVTLFELTPAPGVKISKIKSLEDDLAMALAARGIRIIAPIPGKAAIGIEIPNKQREFVRIRSILDNDKFRNTSMELPIAMGKMIDGDVYIEDLTKMPHLLIAGATGSGKSVGVNSLITGLLYHKHPADLKFVMIDPKKIELQQYAAIANHYIAMPETAESPIITDFTQAFGILKSCEKEMELRYDLLSDATVRGIKDYNKKVRDQGLEGKPLRDHPELVHRYLPYIVVIVDELADLMMTAGKEIEGPIARLAQMARAVGIHLVLATQRPSVDVITGLIKANFPARIAFQVASKIDARTILDQNGAEQLVGNGDMLYMNGSRMVRVQGPFISVDEVEDITQFIANQRGGGPYPLPIISDEGETADPNPANGGASHQAEKKDPLFDECARILVRAQQGSVSLLQRKFSIGYTRAARIVDQLEKAGIVGPFEGSKARAVLVKDEFELDDVLRNLGD